MRVELEMNWKLLHSKRYLHKKFVVKLSVIFMRIYRNNYNEVGITFDDLIVEIL